MCLHTRKSSTGERTEVGEVVDDAGHCESPHDALSASLDKGWFLGVLLILLAKLDGPVGDVNEMLPDLVGDSVEVEVEVRSPERLLRPSDERHIGLLRSAVRFRGIALLAATDDVLPGGSSPEMARDDVVEVEVLFIHGLATILAGVFVPLVNVLAGELDLLVWRFVVQDEEDDAGHGYSAVDAVKKPETPVGSVGEMTPIAERKSAERAVFLKDGMGMAAEKHADGPAGCADVHSLPQPVENQNRFVKDC